MGKQSKSKQASSERRRGEVLVWQEKGEDGYGRCLPFIREEVKMKFGASKITTMYTYCMKHAERHFATRD